MKQIPFITVQADNVVLWGNPAGALWNRGELQRTEPVAAQGRRCVLVCYMPLLFQIRNFKAWKRWEYPGPPLYHIPAFSHFFKNHPPHRRLPGRASVYGQCTVTVCRPVTECRPASEGLGPAYKTTHWLRSDCSRCLREECVCEYECVATTSLTNCTMYANMPH